MTDATKGNILFVDDDKFLADMYSMKFSAAGYTIHTCLSVAEAIAALKAGFEPDAIVFDLTMPERDGFSLLEEVVKEALAPHAALIALTNASDPADKERAEQMGVHRHIVKASMIPSEVVQAVGEEIVKRNR
ncbi:response regulator [Candidatus Kaiserbacteria bacterium]|nr:response regulator [Candidatus Kaiserbacteria bacterium]